MTPTLELSEATALAVGIGGAVFGWRALWSGGARRRSGLRALSVVFTLTSTLVTFQLIRTAVAAVSVFPNVPDKYRATAVLAAVGLIAGAGFGAAVGRRPEVRATLSGVGAALIAPYSLLLSPVLLFVYIGISGQQRSVPFASLVMIATEGVLIGLAAVAGLGEERDWREVAVWTAALATLAVGWRATTPDIDHLEMTGLLVGIGTGLLLAVGLRVAADVLAGSEAQAGWWGIAVGLVLAIVLSVIEAKAGKSAADTYRSLGRAGVIW